jgi:hypothetical protein
MKARDKVKKFHPFESLSANRITRLARNLAAFVAAAEE